MADGYVKKVKCLVCLKTTPDYGERVKACRETWISTLPPDYAVIEVFGRDGGIVPRLDGDRLFVDAADHYYAMHRKTYYMLDAVIRWFDFEWLVISDDDTYFNDLARIVDDNRGDVVGKWWRVVPESVGIMREWFVSRGFEGRHNSQLFPASFPSAGHVILSRRAVESFLSVPRDDIDDLRRDVGADDQLIGNLFERFDDLKKGYVVDGDYFHGLCGCSPSEMRDVHATVLAKRYDKLWPPFEMGEMIFGGKMGMKVDSALAFSVWKGGAEAGFRKCAEKVSWALHDGIGVEMNLKEASKWENMALQMGDSLVMLYSMPSTGSSVLLAMLGLIRGFSCADDPYGSSRGKRAAAYSEWVVVGCIQEMIDQKRSFRHPAGTVRQEFEEVMLIAPALKVAVLRRRNRLRGAVLEEMRKAIASWAREDGGETGPSVILDIEIVKERMDAATALEIEADKFLAAKYKDGTAISFYYEDLFGDGKTIPERYAEFLRLLKFMEAPKPESEAETRLMTMLDVVPDGSWDTFEMVSNIHDIEDRLGSDEGGWVFGSMNMNDCHLQLMRRYFQMEGDRCRFGVGRERNDKLAVEFWIRGMHIGSIRCITNLGWAYKEGFGVEQDFVKAVELWEKGAVENDPECVRYLAWAYREGKGVSGDIPKAVELWTMGAALGDIRCISGLAWAYKEGFGVEQNLEKAVELWMKGVAVDDPECIRYLAWAFKAGQGINCHPETAFGLWKRGTDLGDNECARNLAWAYIEGFGVGKDVEKAASILGALVAVNDIKAILNLVFLCGNSVIVRPEGTVRDLLKKGAELGDVECMKGLAFQNRHGHDGPANEAEAIKWDAAAAGVTSEGCQSALIAGNEPELPPSQSS